MAEISPVLVKELREKTNAGMMDCKKALQEANGDIEKAEDLLREKGKTSASEKASRVTKEGIIASYIHMQGKVGVLVEVNCETDFVGRNDIFREFVKDITQHLAAMNPSYISRDDVPASVMDKITEDVVDESTKKTALETFFSTNCLLDQAFIKKPDTTVKDFLNEKIAELGENIIIRRFVRYAIGE